MSYEGRVYRVLIASPSDVEEEREQAVRVIQEWNDVHSYNRQLVLLPVRWETHTAPAYNVRPQEEINRAIVDNCDLLIGIFWTRLGTPTGEAASGTLEEIERVAKAGKPVMLYFSKARADLETVNFQQYERLKAFEKQIFPNALVESYKSVVAFRDKLARQLQIKLDELQQRESNNQRSPLRLLFLRDDLRTIQVDDRTTRELILYRVMDIHNIIASHPQPGRDDFSTLVWRRVFAASSLSVGLGIENVTSSGIRSLYVEMLVTSDVALESVEHQFYNYADNVGNFPTLPTFVKDEDGTERKAWKYNFTWDAIQPQRLRPIIPPLAIRTAQSTSIKFTAKVFADNFPAPISLEKSMSVDVKVVDSTLQEVVPNWKALQISPADTSQYKGLLSGEQ